ncbi:MAG: hypothetical protein EHM17_08475 [Verrucomicrobiaceae bacterium]|nr:MAG: hypothetical protein EHM17_08475 [Verrucomicrobiaceae bacterium]
MKSTLLSSGLFALALVSCKQDKEIKVYRVAKEAPAGSAAGDPHAGMPGMMPGGVIPGAADGADPHAGIPGMDGKDPHAGLTPEQLAAAGTAMAPAQNFSDSPPAHWKKQPPSAMLLAKYQIQGEDGATVDVTFSTLRSAPGGLLANINRWRGQLGQESFDDASLKENSRTVVSGFGDAVFVEIEGLIPNADPKKDGRLIGAIAESGPSAWFFKLRGNAALAAAERENFINWIASVKPAEPSKVPMHGTAPGEGVTPPKEAAVVPAGDGSVTWQLPDGWAVVKGSSARYATIAITGADASKGELAVTHFPGDVGGDLANVNRWRAQIGLPPIEEAALAESMDQVAAGPKTIKVIDATGPQNRCAAGWTAHGGETWFFKFTGPDALVGAEKAKFTAFLESIRFNKPE